METNYQNIIAYGDYSGIGGGNGDGLTVSHEAITIILVTDRRGAKDSQMVAQRGSGTNIENSESEKIP